MSQVVHIQTTIQTVFGVLDDEGNVIPQEPIAVQAPVFSSDMFTEAHERIRAERDRAIAAMKEDGDE